MIGNLLGLKEIAEKKDLLNNETGVLLLNNVKCLLLLGIFFQDWYSLREASKIYNPNLSSDKRNDRVVAYYFYKFKSLGWLEEKSITKKVTRKSKLGKKSIYSSKCNRYRLNFNPYLTKYHLSGFTPEKRLNAIKNKVIPYLENNRDRIVKEINKNSSISLSNYIFTLEYIHEFAKKKLNNLY